MQEKHWTFQYRADPKPWAICAIVTFPRGNERAKKVAFDIYSEKIRSKAHCYRLTAQHYDDAPDPVELMTGVLINLLVAVDYSIREEDEEQIRSFIKTIY